MEKCKICGVEITEENHIMEDTIDGIHERANYFGISSLTDYEQYAIDNGDICEDCVMK